MLSDIRIARSAKMRPILDVAEEAGILSSELELHGHYKAKVSLHAEERLAGHENGRYIFVTAVTPTPMGEGKTVTTVGLGQALGRLGKNAFTCIRQPSLGPVFGLKGGAAGGGYAQVLPMEDINLHLTGDIHAITAAHNLCAAFIDNHLHHRVPPEIDPRTVTWRRVIDISDRSLREVVIGLAGRSNGPVRESGFDIAVSSELMAILAMAEDLGDMRRRIGRIVIGSSRDRVPVTTEDLRVAGAMTVLMKDTVKPNLVQNLEGGPVFVHAGPFANIAPGNNSIIADRMALRLADYVVTESGFGADMGAEKFVNVKCRASGLRPDAAVLVCSVRALKMHSGRFRVRPGAALPPELLTEDLDALQAGLDNLVKQVENVRHYGVPCVVTVNRFPTDTEAEHAMVKEAALRAGAVAAVSHEMHACGGAGGEELALAVMDACELGSDFRFTYEDDDPTTEKISKIATRIYGASEVLFSEKAEDSMRRFTELGYGRLSVCMAKTHLSLSHDPDLKGRPEGFRLPVRDVTLSAGAGFLIAMCGDIMMMPGLPSRPSGELMDIDEHGEIVGLS